MSTETPRILSIHVNVVHGNAGNKCIVLPLQLLGFEVDAINTAQYAAHLGYEVIRGLHHSIEDIEQILQGLELNAVNKYDYLITGYLGEEDSLKRLPDIVKRLKEKNPDLIYVCDPIMGDDGNMYLPEELLPVYRDAIVPITDILTPNQYEAEWLTGVPVKDISGAVTAIRILHDRGVKIVLISSLDSSDDKNIISIASDKVSCYQVSSPKLPTRFSGTGDLLAGLFVAWTHLTGGDIKRTLENSIASVQHVVRDTYEKARKLQPSGNLSPASVELRLHQNRKIIECPNIEIKSVEVKL